MNIAPWLHQRTQALETLHARCRDLSFYRILSPQHLSTIWLSCTFPLVAPMKKCAPWLNSRLQ
jgi:hypothetical protein